MTAVDGNGAGASAPGRAGAAVTTAQPPRTGAGFDCGKAATRAETLICGNPELARLDGELAAAYGAAMSKVEPPDKTRLRDEQQRWLRQTRDLCPDVACMKQVYAERIGVLAGTGKALTNRVSCETPTGESSCVNVVIYRDPNSRVDAFNELLTEQGKDGRIVGCRTLIDLPAGTANGNHSFGGYCVMEAQSKRTDVRVCNDEMVGNFAIEPVEGGGVVKDLIDFTSDRCAEG